MREVEGLPWREVLLRRLLIAIAPITAMALGLALATLRGPLRVVLALLIPLVVLQAIAAFASGWPYRLRALILVAVPLATAFISYVSGGFLANGSIAVATAVVLAGLLFGRGAMLAVLGLGLTAPLGAALGMLTGTLSMSGRSEFELTAVEPWIRSTLVSASFWAILGLAVTFVVARIERALAATSGALASVRGAEARRHKAEEERREAERAALEGQKLEMVGRLAAGVAHDFNNVLAVVGGWIGLAFGPRATAADREEAAAALDGAVRQGTALTRQLLALARKDARSVRRFRLDDSVKVALNALRRVLPEDITLTFQGDEPVCVDADDTEVQQTLFNLVINARDAMPGGGAIRVVTGIETVPAARPVVDGTLASGSWAFLRVDDSGPGVPPAIRGRIFEPFFTTKAEGGGTGLGLATVLRIAHNNGGAVALDSEPGQGSRFTVYLPLAPGEPATVALPVEGQPDRPLADTQILVVEDAAPVRRVVTSILERAGYGVVAVGDGRAALDQIERAGQHFDSPVHRRRDPPRSRALGDRRVRAGLPRVTGPGGFWLRGGGTDPAGHRPGPVPLPAQAVQERRGKRGGRAFAVADRRAAPRSVLGRQGARDAQQPEESAMLKKVAFTMYPITDVPRARDFYENKLGLKIGSHGNQGDQWWIEYDLPGGGCFALTNFTEEKPSDAAGGTIAFEVEDLDALIADLRSKNVVFKGDIIHSPVCRMAVCLDSEGNSILLHQLKPKGAKSPPAG